MANINVSYEELRVSGSQIASGRDQIFSELDKMKLRISNLVSSGFVTDSASKSFGESFEKFTTGARSTIQGLDEVIRFLKIAETTLQETDSKLAQAIR